MAYRFEPLAGRHDRSGFRCGSPLLDAYLRQIARKDTERRVAATFVMVEETAPATVVGYYTLSAFAVEATDLPEDVRRRLPRYPRLPATLLGRLARHERFPGTGSLLLVDALKRALRQSSQIASLAVVADAKDENALTFYRRFGFERFGSRDNRVFLPMGTIAQFPWNIPYSSET